MECKAIHSLLFLLCCSFFSYSNQIDSLLEQHEIKNDAQVLNQLAKAYRYVDMDSSIYFAKDAIAKAHLSDNKNEIAYGYFNLAVNQYLNSNYHAAIQHFNSAKDYYEKANFYGKHGALHNNLGNCYSSISQYENALFHYEKALEIKKEQNKLDAIAATQHNIGDIFSDWGKYDEALNFYYEALEYYQNQKDQYHIGIVLNNIGTVYQDLKIFDKSLDFYFQSLQNFEKAGIALWEAAVLSNIGNIYYYDIEDLNEAEKYYQESLAIYSEANDRIGQAIIYNSLGYLMMKKRAYKLSEINFNKALQIATTEKNKKQIYLNYLALSELYEQTKSYNEALHHYKKYTNLKDSVFNAVGQRKLSDFEAKYELFVKEKELEALKMKHEIQNLSYGNTRKLENVIAVLSTFLVISITYIVFQYFKTKSKKA